MDEHTLIITLGAVGVVILASAIVSGIVERAPVSQVLVFVALGVLCGPWLLGIFDFGIESVAVESVATVSLMLVLFTDGIKINLGQLRSNWVLPAIALGPGALLTMLIVGLAAHYVLDFSWSLAFLSAAILASTDAVLLRDVVGNRRVPLSVRHTLSIEAGMNDVIVLPLTLALAVIVSGATRDTGDWLEFAIDLLVLAPLVGAVTAIVAIRIVTWLRRRRLIRRDYESLYSIGVACVAFAAAESIGGSGFIAAFAAGLTIAVIDVELCDCFLEYGETTAEMAMLLTFVFLGAALVSAASDAFSWQTLLFAFLVLLARPLAFSLALARSQTSRGGRFLIAWFGPRGLNSILLTIIAVSAGVGGHDAELLFGAVSLVVLASTIIHGGSVQPVVAWYGRQVDRLALPEETVVTAGSLFAHARPEKPDADIPRMAPAELKRRLDAGEPITVLDVRRSAAFDASGVTIPTAIRMENDEIHDRLAEIPPGVPIALFCA